MITSGPLNLVFRQPGIRCGNRGTPLLGLARSPVPVEPLDQYPMATHFGRATQRDHNGRFQRSTAARGLAEYRTCEYARRETKILAGQACCICKRRSLAAATIGAIVNIGVSVVPEPFYPCIPLPMAA
jgi:hypothetical protein